MSRRKLYRIIIEAAAGILLIFVLVFFLGFRVTGVQVEGNSFYTDDQIKNMILDVPMAKNSILAGFIDTEKSTKDEAMIDSINVSRVNRNTLLLQVKEKQMIGYIEFQGQCVNFDRQGIVQIITEEPLENVPKIEGIDVKEAVQGERLSGINTTKLNTILSVGKMLEKMEVLEKPQEIDAAMRISLKPRITSGNDVLMVEHLSKSFPSLPLFEDLNFTIKRGEKVAIIGNNGTGKTTILKILNHLLPPDGGSFRLGSKVHIGYYDQEHHVLHMEKTVFEEISDDYPNLTNTEIRNLLAAFLFTGDDVFKPISALSGGERGRVSLAKLMLSEANFLILDEPTNHLDIISKEILEDALNNYEGTVLYVSHDRYFINRTATRILELTNHRLVNYIGNYDYYLEKKEELTSVYAPGIQEEKPLEKVSSTKQDWQQKKEEQARIRKRENDLKKTEKAIEDLESRDKEIDEELAKPEIATDPSKCIPLSTEKAEIAGKLEELYEKWEELAE